MPRMHLNYGNPVNRAHPLARDLVAWWKVLPSWMGGGQLWDLCGRYPATLTNGPTWNGGRPGGFGSLKFPTPGSSRAVTGTVSHGIGTGPFTFSCWVNPIAINTAAYEGVMGNDNFSPGLYVNLPAAAKWGVYWAAEYSSGVALTVGAWQHTLATRNGSTISFYLNGADTGTTASVATSMANAAFCMGQAGPASGSNISLMDDVFFHARGFSASEAAMLYRETQRPDNPMLSWIRPVRVNSVAAPGGRTTRNTRAFPLGVSIGMDFNHCNI